MPDGRGNRPRTLDLIGHSTRSGHLLRLGRSTIDLLEPAVERFCARLSNDHILERLNIQALRLLGCETAVEPGGQWTIRRLARILRIPVFGSRKPILRSHFCEAGFDPVFAHVLIESARLPDPPAPLERWPVRPETATVRPPRSCIW